MLCKWTLVSCLSQRQSSIPITSLLFYITGIGWLTCAATIGMSPKTDMPVHTKGGICEASSLPTPHPLTLTWGRSELPWGHVRTRSTSHSNHSIAFALTEWSGRAEGRDRKGDIHPHPLILQPFHGFPCHSPIPPHKSSALAFEARLDKGFLYNSINSYYQLNTFAGGRQCVLLGNQHM